MVVLGLRPERCHLLHGQERAKERVMGFGPKDGEIRLALAEYLRQGYQLDLEERKAIQTVTGWMDYTINSGYCDTCYYERAVVRVFYTTWDGESREVVVEEPFSDLIRELDEVVTKYGEDR
jgi:hypothetical protein